METRLPGPAAMVASEFAPPGRRVQLDGRGEIWVREHLDRTDGHPVVLLHGLGATAGLNWAGAFRHFDPSLRVIGVDHRGHGRGIRTDRFCLEDCADDAAALIRQLGLRQPIVVGYSMGGPIATLMWQRHPECVGSLVLCATGGSFRGGLARRLGSHWAGTMALLPSVALPFADIRAQVLDRVTPQQWRAARLARWVVAELAGHDPRAIWQAVHSLDRFDSAPWLGRIDVPTTVIATLKDRLVPVEAQLALARSIPDAELRAVASGHLSVAGPGEVEFLDQLNAACRGNCKSPECAAVAAEAV